MFLYPIKTIMAFGCLVETRILFLKVIGLCLLTYPSAVLSFNSPSSMVYKMDNLFSSNRLLHVNDLFFTILWYNLRDYHNKILRIKTKSTKYFNIQCHNVHNNYFFELFNDTWLPHKTVFLSF